MTAASRTAIWALLAVLAAALVVADPYLSALLPSSVWQRTGLRSSPIRILPLLAVAAGLLLALLWAARRARDFTTGAIALLLITSQLNGIGLGPLDLFDMALFGVAAFWIVVHGLNETRAIRLSPLFFMSGMLLLLTLAHIPVTTVRATLFGLVSITRVVLISFLLVDLCRKPETLDFALRVLVGVATFSAAFGIVQFALAYLGIVEFTLIDPPKSAFKPTPIGYVMRSSALCSTPQNFSSFLVYALPAALWRLSETRRLRDAAVVVTILAGVASSLNFGALFGAMLVFAIFPALRWPRLIIHILISTVAVFAALYFLGILDLIYDLSFGDAGIAKGLSQRKTLFELGLEEIKRNPLVGTGLSNFVNVSGNFWHRPVHNIFGQAASELGILAALTLVFVFIYLTIGLAPMLSHRSRHLKIYATAFMMLLASLLMGQTEPNLDQSNFWIVLSLAQAAILVAPRTGARIT